RSSALAATLTRPAPGETDHDHGEPTTVHQPPVPALPQPLVTVRWKPSAAAIPPEIAAVALPVLPSAGKDAEGQPNKSKPATVIATTTTPLLERAPPPSCGSARRDSERGHRL